jgi:hypothetical protein
MASEHGATFEPDEHIATLVLRHVGDVRDRLALECVSSVWRAVGQIPDLGCPRNSLTVLTGDRLAARLTDARLFRLLRRAGPNLRTLVVNGAPAAFTGEGLVAFAAHTDATPWGGFAPRTPSDSPAFARLQTLDLSRCPGVTGPAVLGLLHQLRIRDAPKAERLHRLALAGCAVDKARGGNRTSTARTLEPKIGLN